MDAPPGGSPASPEDASSAQTSAPPPDESTPGGVTGGATPQAREPSIREDPLGHLARAAGYSDGEKWWEAIVEQRREVSDVFAGVLEAMAALRAEVDDDTGVAPSDAAVPVLREEAKLMEQRREAAMRQAIRAAQKEGFQRIAVVCGAWHAPVLSSGCGTGVPPVDPRCGTGVSPVDPRCGTDVSPVQAGEAGVPGTKPAFTAKADAELLKGLPKLKVSSTWVPWTYGRLASASGYGAGIDSPGWYEHLWMHSQPAAPGTSPWPDAATTHWLSRVAALLREADLDASPAQIIDSVRMVHNLTAIRNRYAPGLAEMNDACLAVLCHGNDAPLRLIHRRLIVSERLGEVPEETPTVPLQRDLQQQQKSLRLPATAEEKVYDLDLRKENDLARSRLLHRLRILAIPWGDMESAGGKKGTFHEIWRVLWKPEFAVALIEASVWGNTVLDAAAARVRHDAAEAKELAPLTQMLNASLLADLPAAIDELMQRVQDTAAVTADVLQMMDAAEPLVRVARYGDVRGTAVTMVQDVVRGLIARICVGLPAACSSLDDEAAGQMAGRLARVHQAIGLLEDADRQSQWNGVLEQLADDRHSSARGGLHGLVAGKSVRLLHDGAKWDADRLARGMSLALSPAQEPAYCAAWLEGFLSGSGLVLVHDPRLWQIVDAWVIQLAAERFTEVLPLLRRTFSTFSAPERRQMGQRARSHDGAAATFAAPGDAAGIDIERADRVLPLLAKILGV